MSAEKCSIQVKDKETTEDKVVEQDEANKNVKEKVNANLKGRIKRTTKQNEKETVDQGKVTADTNRGFNLQQRLGDKAPSIEYNGLTLVFFDLETTGLEGDCDIVQISCICGNAAFDQYVLPTKSINPAASRVNGITVRGSDMFCKGQLVPHLDPEPAMQSFVTFLSQLKGALVLVAHNGHHFDVPRLTRVMKSVRVGLPHNVEGFLDTIPLMKSIYPGRRSYGQPALVSDILGTTYDAHNSAADVEALQSLFAAVLQQNVVEWSAVEKHIRPRNVYEKDNSDTGV